MPHYRRFFLLCIVVVRRVNNDAHPVVHHALATRCDRHGDLVIAGRAQGPDPTAELVGRDTTLLYASREEFERLGRLAQESFAASGSCSGETDLRRRDGTAVPVRFYSRPVTEAEGTGFMSPEQYAAGNTNGDDGLSQDEFMAVAKSDFTGADLDGNGALN